VQPPLVFLFGCNFLGARDVAIHQLHRFVIMHREILRLRLCDTLLFISFALTLPAATAAG